MVALDRTNRLHYKQSLRIDRIERFTTRCTQYAIHNTQYTIHNTQYTMHITEYTIHNTQYIYIYLVEIHKLQDVFLRFLLGSEFTFFGHVFFTFFARVWLPGGYVFITFFARFSVRGQFGQFRANVIRKNAIFW